MHIDCLCWNSSGKSRIQISVSIGSSFSVNQHPAPRFVRPGEPNFHQTQQDARPSRTVFSCLTSCRSRIGIGYTFPGIARSQTVLGLLHQLITDIFNLFGWMLAIRRSVILLRHSMTVTPTLSSNGNLGMSFPRRLSLNR